MSPKNHKNDKYGEYEHQISGKKCYDSKKSKKARDDTNKQNRLSQSRKTARKNNQLKLKYGITLEIYDRMLAGQNGCCAICGKHHTEFRWGLCVDHDHDTGNIRGLLCTGCNARLGGSSGELFIKRAAIYLKRS